MNKDKRITVRITRPFAEWLKEQKKLRDESKSEIIRRVGERLMSGNWKLK